MPKLGEFDELRRLRKLRWGIAFLSLGALAATPPLLLRQPPDGFRFLSGRAPIITGVAAGMNGNPDWQYRVYSWKQSYDDVVKQAMPELKAMGFASKSWAGYITFEAPGHGYVEIKMGKSQTRKQAMGRGPSKEDWVTVVCGEEPPDNWLYHARLAIEPRDY